MSDIYDSGLAGAGVDRIEWALKEMPVVRGLLTRLAATRPLAGVRISGCLHITTETANLARTLKAAGADLVLCASNRHLSLNMAYRCMPSAAKIPGLIIGTYNLRWTTSR